MDCLFQLFSYFPLILLQPELVVRRISGLSVLRKKCNYFFKRPEKFRVQHKGKLFETNFKMETFSLTLRYFVFPYLLEYSFHQAKVDDNGKVEF